MNKKITWQIKKVKLSLLKPFEFNPRRMTEKGMKDLGKSIDKFGLAEPIVINTDYIIIGGHTRYYILKDREEKSVDCYVPSRTLDEKEIKELNIRLNKNIAGSFDFDILELHTKNLTF